MFVEQPLLCPSVVRTARAQSSPADPSPVHDSPPWGRESWIWRTLVVEIPLKSSFVSPLQELLYLLRPPILSDDHVDDTRMSNFMSCVMQDVTILLWRTPGFLWHRFPLHHPVGLPLPTVPEWMVYTVLRPCNTPESMISPVYHHPVGPIWIGPTGWWTLHTDSQTVGCAKNLNGDKTCF